MSYVSGPFRYGGRVRILRTSHLVIYISMLTEWNGSNKGERGNVKRENVMHSLWAARLIMRLCACWWWWDEWERLWMLVRVLTGGKTPPDTVIWTHTLCKYIYGTQTQRVRTWFLSSVVWNGLCVSEFLDCVCTNITHVYGGQFMPVIKLNKDVDAVLYVPPAARRFSN